MVVEIEIVITEESIDAGKYIEMLKDNSCGAISTFIGTTRDSFQGKQVVTLSYSCYQSMAEKELYKIAQEACQPSLHGSPPDQSESGIRRVVVVHRLGEVPVGEKSVLIGVSSQHRRESLRALDYVLEQLKARVPIWKKEVYLGGESSWKDNKNCC